MIPLAIQALICAGIWFAACAVFALGCVVVQAAREVLRERNAR